MKYKFFPAIFVLLVFFACSADNVRTASYELTEIRRGTVERTVSSGGTINPVAAVRVLPRMSGKVENVYADFNDVVKRGDILAELNTDMLRLRREQQHAAVVKAHANYELQLMNFRNQETLAQRELISEFELRTSRVNLNNLAADLAVAQANLRVIETEINQYAFITSPIDGIVLVRNINAGDTVVDSSSNNSSSIFIIAENLREMQIEAIVGELDITSIHRGQPVRFSMESLPGRRFSGVVETLRLIPAVTNNVVSYTVIINVENHDGSLLPGMTCAVEFIVDRSEDVLLVPNAALRFQPTCLSDLEISDMVFTASLVNMTEEQQQAAIEARAQTQTQQSRQNQNTNSGLSNIIMGGQGAAQMTGTTRQPRQAQGQRQSERSSPRIVMRNLWYFGEDGALEVMQVRTGISDGLVTEVFLPEEFEGFRVIHRRRVQ